MQGVKIILIKSHAAIIDNVSCSCIHSISTVCQNGTVRRIFNSSAVIGKHSITIGRRNINSPFVNSLTPIKSRKTDTLAGVNKNICTVSICNRTALRLHSDGLISFNGDSTCILPASGLNQNTDGSSTGSSIKTVCYLHITGINGTTVNHIHKNHTVRSDRAVIDDLPAVFSLHGNTAVLINGNNTVICCGRTGRTCQHTD